MNKIVRIVHECTKKWDGAPTKNYGDKYLLTWRIPAPRSGMIVEADKKDNQLQPEAALRRDLNIKFLNSSCL